MGDEIIMEIKLLDQSDDEMADRNHPEYPDVCKIVQVDFFNESQGHKFMGRSFIDLAELKKKLAL